MLGLKVFLLDDSKEMQSMISELVESVGGTLLTARSRDEAIVLMRTPHTEIHGAIVDLMIPIDENRVQEVDRLMVARNSLCMDITARGSSAEIASRREKAKIELENIDKQIVELTDFDGGIDFLVSPEGKQLARIVGDRLAIFSARRADIPVHGSNEPLRVTILKVLGRESVLWFEKPVYPEELLEWIRNIRDNLDELAISK